MHEELGKEETVQHCHDEGMIVHEFAGSVVLELCAPLV
jgi:hypothetical protein